MGSALVRIFTEAGYTNLLTKTKQELDLLDEQAVIRFYEQEKPDAVILAAAKVGGIRANNSFPADFIYDNLQIQTNVIRHAHLHQVKKLLFLGSSCIYPRMAPQPIKEEYLLSGPLEPTNEPYAIAKIAGIKMCESYRRQYGCDFVSAMPTNLYGPNDNFDLNNSHVLPALIRKAHEAKERGDKEMVLWGTGQARREFLYVDDMARACLTIMEKYSEREIINVGCGEDVSVKELALLIMDVVGYDGEIVFDSNMPDGMPKKLLNVDKLKTLGWQPRVALRDGIALAYEWYRGSVKGAQAK